jgi:DNA-binding transcriptional MerR regulator
MEINFSKSDSEIEDYIIDLLKNTNKSIKEIENQIQDDPSNLELQSLRTKIITEWKELIKNVRSSLKSNRDFTEQELAIIKLDQSNIIKLSDQNSTSTEILNSA